MRGTFQFILNLNSAPFTGEVIIKKVPNSYMKLVVRSFCQHLFQRSAINIPVSAEQEKINEMLCNTIKLMMQLVIVFFLKPSVCFML